MYLNSCDILMIIMDNVKGNHYNNIKSFERINDLWWNW
jgi:hypothetical protein